MLSCVIKSNQIKSFNSDNTVHKKKKREDTERQTQKYDSGLSLLRHEELHWLDVTDRVRYKLAVLAYRSLDRSTVPDKPPHVGVGGHWTSCRTCDLLLNRN